LPEAESETGKSPFPPRQTPYNTFSYPTNRIPKGTAVASANLVLFAAPPSWVPPLLMITLLLLSAFLIFVILLQKGKGGGLAGAFGGAGGSSAFGSRAGDTFTRITIYVALFWALLIMITIKVVPLTVQAPTGAAEDAAAERSPGGPSLPEGDAP
jgi:preprotein translocase subunit SecG